MWTRNVWSRQTSPSVPRLTVARSGLLNLSGSQHSHLNAYHRHSYLVRLIWSFLETMDPKHLLQSLSHKRSLTYDYNSNLKTIFECMLASWIDPETVSNALRALFHIILIQHQHCREKVRVVLTQELYLGALLKVTKLVRERRDLDVHLSSGKACCLLAWYPCSSLMKDHCSSPI